MKGILSHYTQLPVLLGILEQKKIVLGSPDNWEDKTDRNILMKYARRKGENIRVMCLTELPEDKYDSILHWKIYAPGISGCRIDFNKDMMIKIAKSHGAEIKEVKYTDYIDRKKTENPQIIPFLKRCPYSPEYEWRIIWTGKENKDFELDISDFLEKKIIWKVKLSAELPKNLAVSLRSFLQKKYKIEANQSWINQDQEWEYRAKKGIT